MEYQKIINLLDNATNLLFKFRTKNQVEMTMHVERITAIFKLNLRLQDKDKFMRLLLLDKEKMQQQ